VIIKTEDKENYYRVLQQADAGILEPFIEYIAQNLVRSLEIMIKGAKGESIEEADDLDKELALLERKLQTVGQKIEVTKSKEVINELFDSSITPLFREFSKMCAKFDRFYVENKVEFLIDGVEPFDTMKTPPFMWRIAINEKFNPPSEISFRYSYATLRQNGLDNVDFESVVNFFFSPTEYKVTLDATDKIYTKPYSEQVNEDEIKEIVNYEAKRHKEFIENQIQSMSKEST
jgi:hypothetical protein